MASIAFSLPSACATCLGERRRMQRLETRVALHMDACSGPSSLSLVFLFPTTFDGFSAQVAKPVELAHIWR